MLLKSLLRKEKSSSKVVLLSDDICEVKRCRHESDVVYLGVLLCDKCHEKRCRGETLNTSQGILMTDEDGRSIKIG